MKIKEFLIEAKMGPKTPGHDRLVTSIINLLKKSGRVPSRTAVSNFLKQLDKDEGFKARVSAKARKLGKPEYIWGSVRKRAIGHFLK